MRRRVQRLRRIEFALFDTPPDSPMESNLQEVMKAGKRARDLVNQILTFAKRNQEAVKPINVPSIAADALKLIRSTIPSSIEIRQRLEAESSILADPVKIHQIFMNICINAAQSMKNGGLLGVDVMDVPEKDVHLEEQTNLPGKDYLKIRISDTGSGIPENTIGLIFEPYFTTKEVGAGTGLGLSVVHGIVKSHGGEIFIDSIVDQGTVFTIYFPITREQPREIPAKSFDLPKGRESVLLVDDEPAIIKMTSQLLIHLGYSVTSRTDSAEALALFQKKPDGFDLVITDMTMPAICGNVLAREMKKIRPDIPILLCTGYSKALSCEKPLDAGAIIMKPVEQRELAHVIRRLLDGKDGTGMKK